MYNEKVVEIFKNPKNVGEIKNASGVGTVGNEACGDIMKLYLKINDKDVITDASFKTFGCAAAIVSSSVATEMIKGKTVEDALKLKNQEILDYLGGLPAHKIHCSVLAKEAIEEAVKDYRKKQAKKATAAKAAKKTETKKETVSKDPKQEEKKDKMKSIKSDIDELIRTSNILLNEIENDKFLRKDAKADKDSKKKAK